MTEHSEAQNAVRDVIEGYRRTLVPIKDLRDTEYLNGHKVLHNVGDALHELGTVHDPDRELPTVDQQERALVLALIRGGLPAAAVARRCRIAPATVRRWLAGETA